MEDNYELLYYKGWEIEKHYHEYGGLECYCVWVGDKCEEFYWIDEAYNFIDSIKEKLI
jgi:hypothetical protein